MRGAALALWGVGCVMPGLLVAARNSQRTPGASQHLSRVYGHAIAVYLAYCPPALLAYLLPLLVLSPVLLLLVCLAEGVPRAAGPRLTEAAGDPRRRQ